jgi:transposase
MGFNNIVINPSDVPTTNKEKYSKTDPVDSRKLARELETGSLKGIYVPDLFHQQFRNLCRLRAQTVQNQTRTKNRIKSFLSLYGIPMPAHSEVYHWSKPFIQWLESLEFACSPGQSTLRLLIKDLQNHRQQLLQVTKEIRKQINTSHIKTQIGYLRSVFGIGFVSAVTLYSELIDIHRFPDFDHLASYVGLIPSVKASGEQNTTRGMTNRQSRYLRSLLIEAAWIAVRKDPVLTFKFSELSRRMPKNKAIVRIAKKLLSRIRYMWMNQSLYVPAIVE